MSTEDLVAHARARFDYQTKKRLLREKYEARLIFAHNGGMFRATPELLAFVQTWPNDELYLKDLYDNPVEIDRQVFLAQLQQHYHEQMNAWHVEYQQMLAK